MALTKQQKELRKNAKRQLELREWYRVRSIFGNTWAYFFFLLGAREAGKSYSVMEQFIKDYKYRNRPFTWLRLKESAQKKLLSNNAHDFVDADLVRRYNLELTSKGNQVYDHGKPMARVLALSTFYNDKGQALFDNEYELGYNICLDECNFEVGERRTVDIAYAFVNQMENLVRSTKEKLRIVIIGNATAECSELLSLFNFIPEEFGLYKLKNKKCVIHYIPPTQAYLKRRKGTVADILTPSASTFTNKMEIDRSLVSKKKLSRPTMIIKFGKDKSEWFTVWDDRIVNKYNKEKVKNVVAMRPYLDEPFIILMRDNIIAMYDSKYFNYRDLITQRRFTQCLLYLKPRGC